MKLLWKWYFKISLIINHESITFLPPPPLMKHVATRIYSKTTFIGKAFSDLIHQCLPRNEAWKWREKKTHQTNKKFVYTGNDGREEVVILKIFHRLVELRRAREMWLKREFFIIEILTFNDFQTLLWRQNTCIVMQKKLPIDHDDDEKNHTEHCWKTSLVSKEVLFNFLQKKSNLESSSSFNKEQTLIALRLCKEIEVDSFVQTPKKNFVFPHLSHCSWRVIGAVFAHNMPEQRRKNISTGIFLFGLSLAGVTHPSSAEICGVKC